MGVTLELSMKGDEQGKAAFEIERNECTYARDALKKPEARQTYVHVPQHEIFEKVVYEGIRGYDLHEHVYKLRNNYACR